MKLLHTQHTDRLERMYSQVKDLELGLLLSGLTILVKDTEIYLTSYGLDNVMAEGFRLAYLEMLSDNRYYWEKFGPNLYLPLKEAGLPEGFASGAAKCEADLGPLTDVGLENEWLRAPGWHFLQTYSGQRKNDILRDITLEDLKAAFCEGRNPYKRDSNGVCDQKEANPYKSIEGVVRQLIGTDQEWSEFWYPVMLYLVLLLQKTNFTTLE
ncbi:hypothetical protein [Nitrosomonas sp.]|uniref:hypothetical protein n=1 Tax=Nitrosomonas sp. TaxID=42353 RepID=UPI00261546F3|nr:hypothetical protein [Nitrosomonas sp.]MCW5599984.1 hypothetical protein [Nitrosomonas sp.]